MAQVLKPEYESNKELKQLIDTLQRAIHKVETENAKDDFGRAMSVAYLTGTIKGIVTFFSAYTTTFTDKDTDK